MAPDEISIVREGSVRQPTRVLDDFRDLFVRSKVMKRLADIYIERHVKGWCTRPRVLQILASGNGASIADSSKAHATERVTPSCPDARIGFDLAAVLLGPKADVGSLTYC